MKWFYLKPLSGSIYILTSIRAEKSWKLLIKLGLKLLVDQGGGGGHWFIIFLTINVVNLFMVNIV